MNSNDPIAHLQYVSFNGAESAIEEFSDLKGKEFFFFGDDQKRKLLYIQRQPAHSEHNQYNVAFIPEQGQITSIGEFCRLNKIHFDIRKYQSL